MKLSKLIPSYRALYWVAMMALVGFCIVVYYQCGKNTAILDSLKHY
ncbi:MAG: hypothetical protein AAB365_00400 [Patescibacteria group bacterium]